MMFGHIIDSVFYKIVYEVFFSFLGELIIWAEEIFFYLAIIPDGDWNNKAFE